MPLNLQGLKSGSVVNKSTFLNKATISSSHPCSSSHGCHSVTGHRGMFHPHCLLSYDGDLSRREQRPKCADWCLNVSHRPGHQWRRPAHHQWGDDALRLYRNRRGQQWTPTVSYPLSLSVLPITDHVHCLICANPCSVCVYVHSLRFCAISNVQRPPPYVLLTVLMVPRCTVTATRTEWTASVHTASAASATPTTIGRR